MNKEFIKACSKLHLTYKPKKGDKVIILYTKVTGEVIDVNGEYIYVKEDNTNIEGEYYLNELEIIN